MAIKIVKIFHTHTYSNKYELPSGEPIEVPRSCQVSICTKSRVKANEILGIIGGNFTMVSFPADDVYGKANEFASKNPDCICIRNPDMNGDEFIVVNRRNP